MDDKNSWKVDKESRTPIYLQVSNYIKSQILAGNIPAGTKLSQRKIAEKFKIGRKPVMEAFEILDAIGLVTSKPQSGTTVTNNLWLKFNENKSSNWLCYKNIGRHKSSPEKIFNAFAKMDDEATIKINGDRIAPCFNPEEPIVAVFDKVSKRLTSTNELGYFGLKGLITFKQALAKHMQKQGIITSTDNIITTTGIGESLAMISYGFINSGTNLFYETPSFINTIMLMQSTGANMNEIPMDSEGIDFEKLIVKLRRHKNSLLYIQPVNHNPTGVHISKKRRDNIMGACAELGVPIIENDMFRDYWFDKPFARPLKAFDSSDQIIYIGSLLSCFMGFKISWIVAPTFIIERLRDIRTHFELTSNIVVEMMAEEMLTSRVYYDYFEKLRPKMVYHYNVIMLMLDKYLIKYAKWQSDNPAFFIWIKFNDNIDILEIYNGITEHLFFPGIIFDWQDKHHARLNTLGVNTKDVESWIRKIAKHIELYLSLI